MTDSRQNLHNAIDTLTDDQVTGLIGLLNRGILDSLQEKPAPQPPTGPIHFCGAREGNPGSRAVPGGDHWQDRAGSPFKHCSFCGGVSNEVALLAAKRILDGAPYDEVHFEATSKPYKAYVHHKGQQMAKWCTYHLPEDPKELLDAINAASQISHQEMLKRMGVGQ